MENISTSRDEGKYGRSPIGEDPGKIHGSCKVRGHVTSVTIM